jgi:hypothetical protein
MATRCDCHWVPVTIHTDVETIWLRADDVAGCPAHPAVSEEPVRRPDVST